jgi:hypothetical protein
MTELIGKSEEEARLHLESQGKKLRVIKRDKESFMFTCEYWEGRVNVRVEDGVVSSIAFVG